MSWRWRPGPGEADRVELEQAFPTQGEAETWLGETYPELVAKGVRTVSLFDEDRLVYGPMSLEPDS